MKNIIVFFCVLIFPIVSFSQKEKNQETLVAVEIVGKIYNYYDIQEFCENTEYGELSGVKKFGIVSGTINIHLKYNGKAYTSSKDVSLRLLVETRAKEYIQKDHRFMGIFMVGESYDQPVQHHFANVSGLESFYRRLENIKNSGVVYILLSKKEEETLEKVARVSDETTKRWFDSWVDRLTLDDIH